MEETRQEEESTTGNRPQIQSKSSNQAQGAFGPRAILVSAAIGFAAGVVVTLAFAPIGLTHSSAPKRHTHPILTPTVVPVAPGAIRTRVRRLADAALGLSYLGKPRHSRVKVAAAAFLSLAIDNPVEYNVTVIWTLNPNPFGDQVGSAREDSFLILKSLYEHGLPLRNVTLVGKFRFPDKHHLKTVLRAGSSATIETHFSPWKKLGRSSEKSVWTALRPHWMAPRFVSFRSGKT